ASSKARMILMLFKVR
ncbi:putative Bax domain protein, partial [Vibrio parahaemolyticus V-223/04]